MKPFEDKIISILFLLLITNPVRTDFCTVWGSRAEENYMLNIESDGRILFRCAVKSCTKTIANKVTSLMRQKGEFRKIFQKSYREQICSDHFELNCLSIRFKERAFATIFGSENSRKSTLSATWHLKAFSARKTRE